MTINLDAKAKYIAFKAVVHFDIIAIKGNRVIVEITTEQVDGEIHVLSNQSAEIGQRMSVTVPFSFERT